jgi:hypothetical protein
LIFGVLFMPVIAIVLEGQVTQAQSLLKFHKTLGVSLHSLKDSWLNERPIVEVEIFEGDYQEKAKIIRSVLKIIHEEHLVAKFYEIPFGEQYAGNSQLQTWEVDAALVGGILDAADKEVDRQLDN